MDKLPQKLSPYEVSTKTNEDVVGFFGELCPFSNFYPAKFMHNGISYHSSKQLIQHQKAIFCNDQLTAEKILKLKSAITCKQLAYGIQNYSHQGWLDAANELCHDGI